MKTNSTKIKVGDYMLKDGTTVNPDEITEEQKSQAIGIIAYLYKEHKNIFLKKGVKNSLKAKGIERPHGIVIALKDVEDGKFYEWSIEDYPIAKENKSLNEQVFYGVDGLEMTDSLTDIDKYPAFQAAKKYEKEVHAPKNTTGWYLPSIGEWFCMLNHYKDFSKFIDTNKDYWTSSESSTDYAYIVYYSSNEINGYSNDYHNYMNSVRPVLAF